MQDPASASNKSVRSVLPTCHTLWIGGALGPVAQACLASFLVAGHAVCLHVYDSVPDVPSGVETIDASSVLHRKEIIRHRASGSVSLFSNRYRYEILATLGGIWIDCDVLCLRPVLPQPYLFGWESRARINGAVLGLPAGSPDA